MAETSIIQDTLNNLTPFQWSLLFLLLVLIIVIGLVMMFWISRKYPSKHKATLDPIFKAILIIVIMFLMHLTAVVFGVLERETLRKSVKWYIVAGIFLIIWYVFIVPYFLNRPIPTWKLYQRYVLPDIRRLYEAEPYIGDAYHSAFQLSRVIPSAYLKEYQERGVNSLLEVFLVGVKHANAFFVLMVRDKFTGESMENIKNPQLSKVNEYMGREVMSAYKEQLKESGMSMESEPASV